MNERGAAGGVVIFWDNKVLELVGMKVGLFSILCHFKNCEDGFLWTFTGFTGYLEKIQRNFLGGVRGHSRIVG